MDGFVAEPTIEEQDYLNQDSKLKSFGDPPDHFDSKINDLSLADSFLDFDSIKEFFENIPPNPDRNNLDFGEEFEMSEKIEFGASEKSLEMSEEGKTNSAELITHGSDSFSNGPGLKVETLVYEKENNSGCCIEEGMGKVSLVGVKSDMVNQQDESKNVGLVGVKSDMMSQPDESKNVGLVGVKSDMMNQQDDSENVGLVGGSDLERVEGTGAKSETVSDVNERESSSESEDGRSSSSSSTSSDDEEEENKEKEEVNMEVKRESNVVVELEEGEIEGVDGEQMVGESDDEDSEEGDRVEEGVEMVGGSDVEFDFIGDGDEDEAAAEPIKSKNELQVLPPVPQVNITLQPHHQMLPFGAVLSVLGAQVIVEGVEKHNPLNEGSILWITESRSPLGLVDEIFGPVKNPYYVVRYNSDSEVPAGIHVGSSISFVQEFADHVLNDKNLYRKGYDASGENDEELSEEAEFSDDEKEAEYKRKLKMEKRGMNDQKPGNRKNNRKKVRNRDGALQNSRQMDRLSQNQERHRISPVPADHGKCPSPAVGRGFVGATGPVPQFPPMLSQTAGFTASLNGVWTNGMPSQQPQSAVFPNGFPSNGMPWPPHNFQQHPNQMPMVNSMPFLHQFDLSQRSLPNVALPGGQPNFFAGPTYAPWMGLVGQNGLNQMFGMGLPSQSVHSSINAGQPGFVGQHGLNQTIGMGFQGQSAPPSTNAVEQGNLADGLRVEQNSFQQPEAPRQFNMGASSSRGRKPYHRGGGRFGGGRGRGHSK